MEQKEFFQRLLAISNSGINYSKDPYDIERFNDIFNITQEFINSNLTINNINFEKEKGYTTPEKWIQMKDISKTILKRFPHIYQARTEILQKQEYIYPFKVWESNEKDILPWWKEYDLIKHYRHQKFNHATLENALNSVAALIILNSYLYELVLFKN